MVPRRVSNLGGIIANCFAAEVTAIILTAPVVVPGHVVECSSGLCPVWCLLDMTSDRQHHQQLQKEATRTRGIRTTDNSCSNNDNNSSHSNSKRGQHSSIDDNKFKNKNAHCQQIQSTSVRYQYVPIWAGHVFSMFHRFVILRNKV